MIKELTSLRFVFICLIFIHHLGVYPGGGSLGVAFFFVLSGFSLTLGYSERIKNTEFSYKDYLKRRLFKFYPLHWICLLLAIPYAVFKVGHFQVPEFIINAALLQSWVPNGDFYFSFNSVSWYLCNTVFLAIIFPFLCRFFQGLKKKILALVVLSGFAIYIAAEFLLFHHDVFQFIYINPISRVPDFSLGILLALIYKWKINDPKGDSIRLFIHKYSFILTLLCLILIGLLIYESTVLTDRQTQIAGFYWPLISVIILLSASIGLYGGGGFLQSNYLVQLGSISFEFYMIHQLVIRYVRMLFESNNDGFMVFAFSLTSFIFSLVMSYFINHILLNKKKYVIRNKEQAI